MTPLREKAGSNIVRDTDVSDSEVVLYRRVHGPAKQVNKLVSQLGNCRKTSDEINIV